MLLHGDNPQVKEDIERFREVKAIIDRADKLHEEAKKTRNRLQKRSLRIQAATLLKQAQEKVPELEQVLGQKYPELKNAVWNRISNDLRVLNYELERFLPFVSSQIQQNERSDCQAVVVGSLGQSPLERFIER